ncbi:citrate synthase/methylcitrate synthase [Ornithinibacillus sp. L9]|uniref:Citrate synthase n=1 Tax=Ornithinibacillus caprae TaxID=2678566 RepID=A0A6N8FMZ7_9BACI|nr:citrate synthase/methylcitrate synthase [Ornithinibacillus caprae]
MEYQPGLKGIVAAESELSFIDGINGVLLYRGIPIERLVEKYSFEEIVYFLLYGEFANLAEIEKFKEKLIENRQIPIYVQHIIDELPPNVAMMDVLRTAISSLELSETNIYEDAIKLIAIFPTIIAYRYRNIMEKSIISPDVTHSHVENFLYMLTGEMDQTKAKILEAYLILTMEHGLNASTFSARVTISTESDLVAAVTSALGTMKGPLHGGAPTGVIDLLNEIRTFDRINEVIMEKLMNKERIMGFGHRVYKTIDPRAESLKKMIVTLENLPKWMELAVKTEQETLKILHDYKPNYKLYTNVEYYAAAILKTLDLDPNLFTAIFSSSRIVGWCAHAIEQRRNNSIFRPDVKYIGEMRY